MTFLQRKEEWGEKRSRDQLLKSSLCSKNTSIPVTLHRHCHQGPRGPVSRFCTVLQESQATELCPWPHVASIKQIFRGNFFKSFSFFFFPQILFCWSWTVLFSPWGPEANTWNRYQWIVFILEAKDHVKIP